MTPDYVTQEKMTDELKLLHGRIEAERERSDKTYVRQDVCDRTGHSRSTEADWKKTWLPPAAILGAMLVLFGIALDATSSNEHMIRAVERQQSEQIETRVEKALETETFKIKSELQQTIKEEIEKQQLPLKEQLAHTNRMLEALVNQK